MLKHQVVAEVAAGFEAHGRTVRQATSGMRVPASGGYGEAIERWGVQVEDESGDGNPLQRVTVAASRQRTWDECPGSLRTPPGPEPPPLLGAAPGQMEPGVRAHLELLGYLFEHLVCQVQQRRCVRPSDVAEQEEQAARANLEQTGGQSDRGQDVELELGLEHEPQDASTPDKADVVEETIPAETVELANTSENAAGPRERRTGAPW